MRGKNVQGIFYSSPAGSWSGKLFWSNIRKNNFDLSPDGFSGWLGDFIPLHTVVRVPVRLAGRARRALGPLATSGRTRCFGCHYWP